ncbi:hypothetical protein ACFL0Y_02210 [Patescibacteria group bacterium]
MAKKGTKKGQSADYKYYLALVFSAIFLLMVQLSNVSEVAAVYLWGIK